MRKSLSILASALVVLMFTLTGCGSSKKDPVSVTGVTLNKHTLTLQVGGSETLVPTIEPSNATDKGVRWSSDNTAVASVSGTGAVSAHAAGTSQITVTSNDGEFTDHCDVTVNAAPPNVVAVTGITLSTNALGLPVGGSEVVIVTIQPANATDKSITWSTDNGGVAEVDIIAGNTNDNGLVVALTQGAARVTVTTKDGGHTASCDVTVNTVPITNITLNKTALSIGVGKGEQLMATILPQNATNHYLSWSSSNDSVATVIGGLVTAVSTGSANITVSTLDSSHSASCNVSVSQGGAEPNVYACGIMDGKPVMWKNGVMQELMTPEEIDTYGTNWANWASTIAVSDSGDVYVAGQMVRENEKRFIAVWKNGALHQLFGDGILGYSVSPAPCLSVSGDDVYVLGLLHGYGYDDGYYGTTSQAIVWKNGTPQRLTTREGLYSEAVSIFVSNEDVYVVGRIFELGYGEWGNLIMYYMPVLWKNGETQPLYTGNNNFEIDTARSVFVSGNDVYILGVGEDYIRQQFFNGVWKNNVLLYTFSGYQNFPINGLHGLWVSGNDVYVSGTVGYDDYYGQNYNEPAFWKNGETIPLSTDFLYGSFGSADFVFVFNNDVYTCGFKENASDQFSAPHRGIIWKNREVLLQAYGEYEEYFVYLHSVFVSDK